MKKIYLENITASNYRNFTDLSLEFSDGVNIIVGPNGSGKTNILESISYLSPGRGLKSAKFDELVNNQKSSVGWETKFKLNSKLGTAEIHSIYHVQKNSRKINYNGSKMSAPELTALLNVMWLTPQMEGVFLDSASNRRRFFDRIVFNFDSSHAKRVTHYEHFIRERNKVLADSFGGQDQVSASWLDNLEAKITEHAKETHSARRKVLAHMQEAIDDLETKFTKPNLTLSPLQDEGSDEFPDDYQQILKMNRVKDAKSGRSTFGVHKTDLIVFHKEKNRQAKICSTGEQKALLISIILAIIESMIKNTKSKPILLLDEIFVHLDDMRANYLSKYIMETNLQTFITTTDTNALQDLAKNAHIIEL